MSTGVTIVVSQSPAGAAAPGSRTTIVGAPDVTAADVGKVLSVADDDPVTLAWITDSLPVLSPSPAGSYTNASVTVDSRGRVTTAASGGSSLPSQTGNSGKYLTTDGGSASWATVSSGALTMTAVKTAAYTAASNDLVRCDPTSAAFTVTLPAASSSTQVCVKNQGDSANVITVARAGSDTIDGATSTTMSSARESLWFYSDGVSDWMVV